MTKNTTPGVKSYRDWLESPEGKKIVLENLGKSGMPLELKARKSLKNHNFQATNARYFDATSPEADPEDPTQDGLWREIDIWASRREANAPRVMGCDIQLYTNIIAECKYSSDREILFFEHPDPADADLSRFPLFVNGHNLLPTRPVDCFEVPVLAERAMEVQKDNASREKDNYSDRTIHVACEQMMAATKYFIGRWRGECRRLYSDVLNNSEIGRRWHALENSGKIKYEADGPVKKVPSVFKEKFIKDNYAPALLKDFPFIPIELYIPILITDENRGIIKVDLDEALNPIDLLDMGACFYVYISENANRYDEVLDEAFALPIIISSLTKLPDILESINAGVEKLKREIAGLVAANPSLLIKEILFNEHLFHV
ncbi:MAG: hypothetical protein ABSA18_05085 [Dehalococcoidia bacterium]|jgi:hypothetical protein